MWVDNETEATSLEQEAAKNKADEKEKGAAQSDSGKSSNSQAGAPDTESLARQIELLRQELKQVRESERYWAEMAQRSTKKRAVEPDEDEEEEDESQGDEQEEAEPVERFLDELASSGVKALRKRGLVTMEEVQKMIERALSEQRKQLMQDAELVKQYPELMDESSPLFSKAREIYREMVQKDPSLKNSPVALEMAAKLARAEVQGQQRAQDSSSARAAAFERIGSQRRSQNADDGPLSPAQREIIAKFNRDGGVRITEEQYRERARRGVNMSTAALYRAGSMEWGE